MGLRYTNDAEPGIRRRRAGRGFAYLDPRGRLIRDPDELARLKALAVPPAWTDVWISPDPRGHLLATGRDARGRKQYRYHPAFRARRDKRKFDHLAAFGRHLPELRRRIARDLRRPGLPREKMLAAVVALLDSTAIRIGNEEYRRDNGSFGLTTLGRRHARVEGDEIRFTFRGKSGKAQRVGLRDAKLARVVRRCQELEGQRLFQYLDERGAWNPVSSDDVNDYIRATIGDEFGTKDFRTWVGTLSAFEHLDEARRDAAGPPGRRLEAEALGRAARRLGNTIEVCRRSYVAPAVLEAPRRRAGRVRRDTRWRTASEARLADFLEAELRVASRSPIRSPSGGP
jgi:DNA topoisomerase-1